ncbi:MAG: hypothetical protein MJA83_16355, partial [Gammaproteobacteria bacterium]|nr:hypothetical protein [Gammaproteobacteria bacterium]
MTVLLRSVSLFLLVVPLSWAEVSHIEITSQHRLSDSSSSAEYEVIEGLIYFTLDPDAAGNAAITDIEYAPVNAEGLVEFSADFKLYVPPVDQANGALFYNVNNRGRNGGSSAVPPDVSLNHPLSKMGFTYLITGWINELNNDENIRLHAPIIRSESGAITGPVRYELSVSRPSNEANITSGRHLAYQPTEAGLANATLTHRLYADDVRLPIERSEFDLHVQPSPESNQPQITLTLDSGFQPGHLYELIYEAENPVLAAAGMAGIRDIVSLMRYGEAGSNELDKLNLPDIEHTMAWGSSQSGRFLRMYVYDGFNADLEGRKVF